MKGVSIIYTGGLPLCHGMQLNQMAPNVNMTTHTTHMTTLMVDIIFLCSHLLARYVLLEYHRLFFPLVEHLDQLEVCLPNSRLLAGILTLAVFQN